ncbi:unnamed protein product [Tilletia laevis]|uniref:MalT-like TPR region domain-containing protein n=2 Tax=Tilletia TaxID=13289 RepID=A0A177TEW3_9BASI|nr:hypothetical protein CF328_g7821 [Tilletia controversa]KAE8184987.1 hypothetical protein CF335_g7859 [Tilletia laevis]KAE8243412.1 hypothetical protein A4X03_0g7773 [Tilletia caries]KAE8185081.1 hypothetical protein CF336_g7555 [Tilletia laevis]CAD6890450.1 unnamed protein product [Tilletia caries]
MDHFAPAKREEVVKALREAQASARAVQRTQDPAERFQRTNLLVMSLVKYWAVLVEIGKKDAACSIIAEAITQLRLLRAALPGHFDELMAALLHDYATGLEDVGRVEDALKAMEECVTVQRSVYNTDPATHEKELASMLTTYSDMMGSAGRHQAALKASEEEDDALKAIEEGVGIHRAIQKANPQAPAADEDFGNCLMTLAYRLGKATRFEEALTACDEGIAMFRSLHIDAMTAQSLISHPSWLSSAERNISEILTTVEEALKLYENLIKTQPEIHGVNLANTFSVYSVRLNQARRFEEAVDFARQAHKAYEVLHAANPERHETMFNATRNNYSTFLLDLAKDDLEDTAPPAY